MTGETDLRTLLNELNPELNPGEYVFCTVNTLNDAAGLKPLFVFQEREGVTVVLSKTQADENILFYSMTCAWITLNVYSSLEAVGLTAAVANALTKAGISCNVVAAYHHDHLFVPFKDSERAMEVLLSLSRG
ncbi:MAG: ACT domain-containing protein [Anaerolineales bacterium]|nr:ACT domain-containing protein [Anaerolineales bacterium]MCE7858929.1 ACT domain-containing protein [Chloroflexi bacterium CFX2]GJQ37478.1 MAG: transporter [Anaerolineaceae bacterium]